MSALDASMDSLSCVSFTPSEMFSFSDSSVVKFFSQLKLSFVFVLGVCSWSRCSGPDSPTRSREVLSSASCAGVPHLFELVSCLCFQPVPASVVLVLALFSSYSNLPRIQTLPSLEARCRIICCSSHASAPSFLLATLVSFSLLETILCFLHILGLASKVVHQISSCEISWASHTRSWCPSCI